MNGTPPAPTSAFPASTATSATTIPASRPSTSATSTGSAPPARTGTSSTRRSRCRTSWPITAARTTCDPASTCAGWRPAGGRPTTRAGWFDFTGDISGTPSPIHARAAAHRHHADRQIQGHVGGWRNGFFVNDGGRPTKPHAEPGPALRAEHAGADLRGIRLDAGRRLRDDHPDQLPRHRLQVHRAELQGHRARGSAPRTGWAEDGAAGRLRDRLQPEPDELVHVPDQQPADRRRSRPTPTIRPTPRSRSAIPSGTARPDRPGRT